MILKINKHQNIATPLPSYLCWQALNLSRGTQKEMTPDLKSLTTMTPITKSDLPVDGEGVVLATEDLRRDVVGRAAEGGGGVVPADALLAHSVVGQLDVNLVIQQHVVQLQVYVDYA